MAIWRPMPREAPTTRATGLFDAGISLEINLVSFSLKTFEIRYLERSADELENGC